MIRSVYTPTLEVIDRRPVKWRHIIRGGGGGGEGGGSSEEEEEKIPSFLKFFVYKLDLKTES